jgi:hypothetical protein
MDDSEISVFLDPFKTENIAMLRARSAYMSVAERK